jgi:hypothetical protein
VASLKQVIDKNRQQRDASGTLVDTSRQAGLASPPITPGGASALGVSPDVSKMAGTPAQKKSALEEASQGLRADTLQDTLRLQNSNKQTSAKKQLEGLAASQKATGLAGLDVATDRVSELIRAEMNKQPAVAAAVTLRTKEDVQKSLGIAPDKIEAAYAALPAVFATGITPEQRAQAVAAFNTAAGKTATTGLFTFETLQSQTTAAADNTGAAGAESIANADTINVGALISSGTLEGYTLESLSGLLGVDTATLEVMTPEQLRSQIELVKAQEFSSSQQLIATANRLGAAERQLAFQEVSSLGDTGVASAEQEVGRLVQDVETLGTVMFNGKEYDFRELLADDKLSKTITTFATLLGDGAVPVETDPSWIQFKNNEPGLAAFILNYRKGLFVIADEVQTATTALQDNMTARSKAGNFNPNAILDPKVREALFPPGEFDRITNDKPTSVGVISFIDGLPEASQTTAVTNLNKLTAFPGLAAQFAELTPEQAAALGLDQPLPNDSKFGKWYKYNEYARALKQSLSSDGSINIDSALGTVFGMPGISRDQINLALEQNAIAARFGDPLLPADVLALLDVGSDGVMDSDEDIQERLRTGYLDKLFVPDISEVLDGDEGPGPLVVDFAKSRATDEQLDFNSAMDNPQDFNKAREDGILDDEERKNLGLTDEEIVQFAGVLKTIGLEGAVTEAQDRINTGKQQAGKKVVDDVISSLGLRVIADGNYTFTLNRDNPEGQQAEFDKAISTLEKLKADGYLSPELEKLLNSLTSIKDNELTTAATSSKAQKADKQKSDRKYDEWKPGFYQELGLPDNIDALRNSLAGVAGDVFSGQYGGSSAVNSKFLDINFLDSKIAELEKFPGRGVTVEELNVLKELRTLAVYRSIVNPVYGELGKYTRANENGDWDFGSKKIIPGSDGEVVDAGKLDPRRLELARDDLEKNGDGILDKYPELRRLQRSLTYWINVKRGRR